MRMQRGKTSQMFYNVKEFHYSRERQSQSCHMCNLRVIKQFWVFSNDRGKVRIGQNSEATFFLNIYLVLASFVIT